MAGEPTEVWKSAFGVGAKSDIDVQFDGNGLSVFCGGLKLVVFYCFDGAVFQGFGGIVDVAF
jgi:hypothetical protein